MYVFYLLLQKFYILASVLSNTDFQTFFMKSIYYMITFNNEELEISKC